MPIGLYLHIPFCKTKCPYCDFYSLTGQSDEVLDRTVEALTARMREWSKELCATADTLYLGGGTPSLLGGKRIAALVETATTLFSMPQDAEITMEANPADDLLDTLSAFHAAGGNRLSLGMQAASNDALSLLGRRHRHGDTARAVEDAVSAGIDNYSLDLMLALSGQTEAGVRASVAEAKRLGASHLSAYLLKLEPGTPYAANPPALPDEDEAANLYLAAVAAANEAGYRQYEISNFARPGFESRHNLKYWNDEEYLGIGPAAHSMIGGKRFAYPRDLAAFVGGELPAESDSEPKTGSPEEYAMLRLRLSEGLTEAGYQARFHAAIPPKWRENAAHIPARYIVTDGQGIRLTPEGFLLSNAITVRLIG